MTQDHFLHYETSFNGLAQANIVGDQQIDPRHGQRPHHRIKLVLINFNAAAEWGLQRAVVSLGNRPPTHCIQKSSQTLGMIERNWVRQRGFLTHTSAWFNLPDDLKFLAKAVVLDR